MIKKIAWETFKNTGDINTFMELKQIENIEKQIKNQNLNQNLNLNLNKDKDVDKFEFKKEL